MSNIILIGFMGAGKDTVGRILAMKTGLRYLSTDEFIQRSEGRTIADIFRTDGEGYFRRKETEVLKAIRGLKNVVIATGGGMVIGEKNRQWLKEMGANIHLDVNLTTSLNRIRNGKQRPLASNRARFRRLYDQRRGLYDLCDYRVNTANRTPHEIVTMIMKRLNIPKQVRYPKLRRHIITTRSKRYPVFVGNGTLTCLSKMIPSCRKILIISNSLVSSLYGLSVVRSMEKRGMELHQFILPDGEAYKNFNYVHRIYNYLLEHTFDRSDMIVALGGGVVSDIAGFVASTYKRGTKFMVISTSLLGQVDAAIGGKTGIDMRVKNSIGTFYQPDLVIIDIDCTQTLSDKDFLNGIAEVIKYGAVMDSSLFFLLEKKIHQVKRRDPKVLRTVIQRCVAIKGEIVAKDEREEDGNRVILNFGHTVGHAVECLSHYRINHGAAVAIGMVQEAGIAHRLGLLSEYEWLRLKTLVSNYGLPTTLPERTKATAVNECIQQDKKSRHWGIRLPILTAIGKARIEEVRWEKLL